MTQSIHGVRAAGMCALAAVMMLSLSPLTAVSADKPKEQQISRVIAKEMEAAQKALKANQWGEAVKNLEAAETKPGLTPFDKKTIYDFKGFAYIRQNKMKEAETAYEEAIATGQYNAEETARTHKMLFQLAASNQQFAKAIEYGKSMSDAGTLDANGLLIMTQVYYQQKDCKNAGVWADKAAAAARKAGETPKETVFQIKLQCASDSQDTPGMSAALVDLIRMTNKTTYWNNYIRILRNDERDDKNLLMIYRVMYDTNSMNEDTDYIEMAQLLGDAALPGEAQMVLEKAQSSNVLKEEHKERTTRLLNSLKTRADSDKKSLPQQDAEAAKAPNGQTYVKTGEVYYGAADYQGAVGAITKGLAKPPVKSQDEAFVYLGRAHVALKNNADAKKAFGQLKSVQGVSPKVQKLWELYAEKLG
jgi:tetratricopeptide (TPR) repeat protein